MVSIREPNLARRHMSPLLDSLVRQSIMPCSAICFAEVALLSDALT